MVASEVTPFGQTGGLGEVLSALPAELIALGLQVDVVMPKYRGIDGGHFGVEKMDLTVDVDLNAVSVPARFWKFRDHRGVGYIFVENDEFYDRDGLYGTKDKDYEDNSARFVFLTRATIEMVLAGGLGYDIFHAHDWPAALIPVYLRTLYAGEELLSRSASVMTIHNLGYQGIFMQNDLPVVGVGWELFNPAQMEFYGKINFLKSGIIFADEVNTVSPGYRREILSPEFGFGLEGVLQQKSDHVSGILNGVDYGVWNPATDKRIAANFDSGDLSGKAACKAELQRSAELDQRPDVPLIGMVSRLSTQKGLDILEEALPALMERDIQLAVLGTGEARYQDSFIELRKRYAGRAGIFLTYSRDLAHQIIAGADMIVVPSRYEPCGLNQLYALKYGTIPVVRATGGLDDTVEQFDRANREGTGFKFLAPKAQAFADAVTQALDLYRRDPDAWKELMVRAMNRDFSWGRSALEYKRMYERALSGRGVNLDQP
jgi:starch synthase